MQKFSSYENISLVLVIVVFGIMAGFFWTYTFNVNLALLQVDGKIYAEVQSLLNENVRHGMFFLFLFFFGGGVFSVLSLFINIRHFRHVSFWVLAAATLVYVLGIIFFTAQVNLPLNYYTESWDLNQLPNDWSAIRESWNHANSIRVGTSFIAFLLSIVALYIRCMNFGNNR